MAPPCVELRSTSCSDQLELLMTSNSSKIRIYELSKELALENKDVLNAAEKLSIAAKSHSSSISDEEAKRIRDLLRQGIAASPSPQSKSNSGKAILSLKKAADSETKDAAPPNKKATTSPQISHVKQASPARPTGAQQPATGSASRPAPPSRPAAKPTTAISPSKAAAQPAKAPVPVNRPVTPSRPAAPAAKAAAIPSSPKPPNTGIQTSRTSQTSTSGEARKVDEGAPRPQIISRPESPAARIAPPAKPSLPSDRKVPRPELVGRPKPKRPVAPPSRPEGQRPEGQRPEGQRPEGQRPDKKRPGISPRPSGGPNQRNNMPQRPGPPTRQGKITRPGQPRSAGNTVELVGKPIRRDRSDSGSTPRDGNNRPGAPTRQGMPTGMRKPVAPGELMQLQKPTGRPGTPPPRRPDGTSVGTRGGSEGATPPVERTAPTPTAPKRPGHRPPQGPPGAPRRPGRPEWDDSAKLEALRNKSPQKQRQKVHIIGENDDALTAETGGYAGEQQAIVLSASLARPSKPKSKQKTAAKPVAAMRKRKKETTRQRQRRRAMELRAAREAKQIRPEMLIVPEANLTVQELADMLSVESSEIIKSLFFKGIIATVTQSLDLSTIETVAEEFGVPVLQDDVEEAAKKTVEMIEATDLAHLIRRPPVVTVMGHVDHGKTSLLDAIRKARVAAGEAGGITQHIGAYQVEIEHGGQPRKITFLDTPGHEAFTAMRARGTKVTDVAVLVVAADDGVRPQTLEAISHARAAKVPIIVAINKTDKEGASPDRVKQELSEQNLLSEEWGGDVVMVPVSAIKGENIDKLLEMILLVTEVEDLQANPDRMAKGTVIEAHLDKAKGPVATLLIQNGTLKTGDVVAAGPVLGKVRAMVDNSGSRLKQAGPSGAVEALGFSEVPTAGDEFEVYPDEKSARAVVGERASDARATRLAQQMASRRVSLAAMSGQASEGELKELNLILKADVQGSVEAILGSLEQLPKDEVQVRVLLSAPGEITETDVDLAAASGAVIVGFNTSMASGAKRAADATGVDVRDYEVIYKLLEDIQMAMEGLLEPELVEESLGEAQVRAVFTIGKSAVAGCYITTGKLQRNCRVRVRRAKQVMFEGDLNSLRRNKDDVKEVATGFECGIGCDRFANWEEGDIVEAHKLVTQRRTLST